MTAILLGEQIRLPGRVEFELFWIDDFLELARDVLWLLDYHAGNDWAISRASEEFRDRLLAQR